ncbi:hypothetical protein B5C34_03910 [Pacificimonas flava]|uniref:PilZ domain-containing protein n=2 Tax=Pacificimonas TaxID=1960290 RepID=A0A219B3G8_9SPHN|nr:MULTISPECIES: PilZ domain-containing protein [Pacificimonas]MBZ6377637.1 PilZ domain-containing protein [Pacificimonas aurantium]OWV32676.1 hypothetical protein B5C34_03910 [Pacificimonas flava]
MGHAMDDKDDSPRRDDERAGPRRRVLFRGELLTGSGPVACTVVDVSAGGARIRTDTPLEPGAPVTLTVPGHPDFQGVIAWGNDGKAGVAFLDIAPRNLDRWGELAATLKLS